MTLFQMSLLEFDPSLHDLVAVSLHTFEKLPQVVSSSTLFFAVRLHRADIRLGL